MTLVSAMTGAGVLVALAVVALPWLDPINRDLAEPFWWTAILIVAGGVVLGGYACWALLRRRPTALVAGVAVLMAGFLAGGVRVHTHWVNRSQDFPGLAALIERYAQGRPVGITGGRFLSIDFYLGRALTPVPTVAAFDAWVTRPERPLVVITDRDWLRYRHEVRSNVEVLDTMRIRTHLMFLVWLAEPGTPRIEGSRAGRELPQPAP